MSTATGDHLDTSPSETVRRHAATFRRVRLARQAALSDGVPAKLEPTVPAREARSDEVPPPARKLADTAGANGWRVQLRYARGPAPAYVESVVVRAHRDGRVVLGCWRAPAPSPPMKIRWAWSWGLEASTEASPRLVGARELAALVAREEPSDGSDADGCALRSKL